MTRAPLRFLVAVLLLWTGIRAAILLPGPAGEIVPIPTAAARSWPPVAALPAFEAAPPPADLPSPAPSPVTGRQFWPHARPAAPGCNWP